MPRRQPTADMLADYLNAHMHVEGECWIWDGPVDQRVLDNGTILEWPVLGIRGMVGKHVRRAAYQLIAPEIDLTGKRVKWAGTCEPLCIRPDHMLVEQWPKVSGAQEWEQKPGPFGT